MSTSVSNLTYCYNKGCGKQFEIEKNAQDSCQFHPGNPIFHDALKGWSCCNKKSTDFTQFLSIPGCTKGCHSNVKPIEPEKPVESKELKEIIVYEIKNLPEPTPRPTEDEPLVDLNRIIASSLTSALEKFNESLKTSSIEDNSNKQIPIGTPCKNISCQAKYENENSNLEKCTFHPGQAIFHEGMKYWSCCQRKTSDFDNFLNQSGCTEGNHLWFKNEKENEKVECRYDFHQTGGFVVLTIYSKNSLPDKTIIRANKIKLDVDVNFESGSKRFVKGFDLFGVIKYEESVVNFFQTKIEIKLKKADTTHWKKLEY